MSTNSEMSRLQVDVDEDVKTQAKIKALQDNVTLSDVVELALRQYLKMKAKEK